jgi:hypothetical protein
MDEIVLNEVVQSHFKVSAQQSPQEAEKKS